MNPYERVKPQAPTPGEAVKPSSFEPLLTDIAANFVNLPAAQIDASITDAQERICGQLGLDRSVLWQFIEDASGKMLLSHIHDTSQGFLPDAPFDAGKTFPWILRQILKGNNVIFECVEDLPPEAAHDRQSLRQWGIKSSFVMPLSVDEKIIGALSFGKLSQATIWAGDVMQRLQLIAQIFANALSRKQAELRLTSLRRFETLVANISAQFINLTRPTASTPRSKTPNGASVNAWNWTCPRYGSGRTRIRIPWF
jgi:formate hydrogenlyase transcriptional activator